MIYESQHVLLRRTIVAIMPVSESIGSTLNALTTLVASLIPALRHRHGVKAE